MTLLAHETEFWMRLQASDAATAWQEWDYHANHESMTEAYSSNCFPPFIEERDQ